MDFENYLLESAKKTDEQVDAILKKWRGEAGSINKSLLPLIDEFIKCNKGGKGIRGVLVELGYKIAESVIPSSLSLRADGLSETKDLKIKSRDSSLITRNDNKEIIKIAAAYEILHTSILAHDDIMDEDIERRGQPSLYQALSGHARNASRSEAGRHYGISQAISLADAGFFLAVKIIAESDFDERLKNQALALFAKTMVDTSLGQMLDVNKESRVKSQESNEENIIQTINLLKTARYTIAGPLKIGAILANADEKLIKLLDSFGENLGIAYQIRDDILDNEVKSVDQAKKRVLEYSAKATKLIPEITEDIGLKKLLEELIDYLIQRSK